MPDELVPATASDKAWLERLRRDVYQDLFTATFGGWDEERHIRHFTESWESGQISIIKIDGEPVGMIQIFEEPDALEIGEVQILPNRQNEGIGSRILKQIIERARNTGKFVKLSTGLKNEGAFRLYERLGFRKTGETESHNLLTYDTSGTEV
jgi:ribosomal protein S18 acetylase RimI-like enzyme